MPLESGASRTRRARGRVSRARGSRRSTCPRARDVRARALRPPPDRGNPREPRARSSRSSRTTGRRRRTGPSASAPRMRAWPIPSIGGVVSNGDRDRRSRTRAWLCDFGRYAPPQDGGPRRDADRRQRLLQARARCSRSGTRGSRVTTSRVVHARCALAARLSGSIPRSSSSRSGPAARLRGRARRALRRGAASSARCARASIGAPAPAPLRRREPRRRAAALRGASRACGAGGIAARPLPRRDALARDPCSSRGASARPLGTLSGSYNPLPTKDMR